jgi:hypothetical protein
MRSNAQRNAAKAPSLKSTHPLERARCQVEQSIASYQALIILEESSIEHKQIPIPTILGGEAKAYVALADILRLQSSLCTERTTRGNLPYLSARGETATKLYELASQNCDVAAGMAGALGNTHVEAMALRALSDVAASRHVNDVAVHRLQRGIDLLSLYSIEELHKNNGLLERTLNQLKDKQSMRTKAQTTVNDAMRALKHRLGHNRAAVEEDNITAVFVKVVRNRLSNRECKTPLPTHGGNGGNGENIEMKQMKLNLDGLFECTQLLGTVPALSEDELVEAMQQIVGGVEGIGAKKITEATEFGLEELVVWWLDGM